MFCYQCEQTAKGTGCTIRGVCGKDPETSASIDLLVHNLKGLSAYTHAARQLGASDRELDIYTIEGLFSTVTNVNFDPERYREILSKMPAMTEKAQKLYESAGAKAGKMAVPVQWTVPVVTLGSVAELVKQGEAFGIEARKAKLGDDITGLQEMLMYGVKGISAYADHAQILGKEDETVYAFISKALAYLLNPNPTVDELLGLCMECGQVNLKAMEILDAANTGTYGHPVPTPVRVEPVKGKAIVVSGHDFKDLEALLKQTEGKGINIYTHGEMLPAHGYPELKKYKHLVGNYGSAWQNQKAEFDAFPGAVLMTTNCIQAPKENYKGRIFTSGVVAFPGVKHVHNRDFSPVIAAALEAEGFTEDGPDKTILVGFGRNAVLGVADKVIAAVKSGAIKHFFLIGGCDGVKPARNYYTEFAQAVPKDSVILTLACGKYKFNKLEFGDIGGIPRLLDVGQCNDAYSAVQIAVALAGAFDCGVNDLPLSIILSWYEQKAVAVLLTLLSLGIKNIKLGPSLPAFVTPAALNILVEKFNIAPITTVEADMKAILGN